MNSKSCWLLVVLTVICGLIGGAVSNWALTANKAVAGEPVAENWADKPAELTIGEYFELYFSSYFHAHERKDFANSLMTANFFPGSSQANALVKILQTWNDDPPSTPMEQRRMIRGMGTSWVGVFEAMCTIPRISNRWLLITLKPNRFIIIRHVRAKDTKETLAVTMDGTTYFDEEHFKEAEERVKVAGGVWLR